jgi:predicted nicotinamide N-methyase
MINAPVITTTKQHMQSTCQVPTMMQVGTAYNAWTSSLLLAKYLWLCSSSSPVSLLPLPPVPVARRSILELGCGVGVVGFTAAKLGGRVTMSDFNDDVLQNVVEGVQANGLQGVGGVDVVKLDWGGEDGEVDGCSSKQRWYGGGDACGGVTHSAAFAQLERGVLFDVVLASDCCYEPDHPRLLCRYCTRFSPAQNVRNTTTFQHATPHLLLTICSVLKTRLRSGGTLVCGHCLIVL